MSRSIELRIRRLEAQMTSETPSVLFSSRPLEDGEASRLMANWQDEVAAGRAHVLGRALMIRRPRLTTDEWCALHGASRQAHEPLN